MVYWYDYLLVHIKWGGQYRCAVHAKCGTHQGGLASPWIFNLFYKYLINILSESNNGVTIKGINYNVYCYADDILISSTSVTGLQSLTQPTPISQPVPAISVWKNSLLLSYFLNNNLLSVGFK